MVGFPIFLAFLVTHELVTKKAVVADVDGQGCWAAVSHMLSDQAGPVLGSAPPCPCVL